MKLEQLPGILTAILAITYLMGYVAIMNHLKTIGVFDSVNIDLRVLKVGALLIITSLPTLGLFFSIFTATDETYSYFEKLFLIQLFNLLGSISLYATLIKEANLYVVGSVVIYVIIMALFRGLFINNKKVRNVGMPILSVIPIVIILILSRVNLEWNGNMHVFVQVQTLYVLLSFVCYIKEDGFSTAKGTKIFYCLFTTLLISGYFGEHTLGEISLSFGGESPRYKQLFFKPEFLLSIKGSDFWNYNKSDTSHYFSVLFETDLKYYISTAPNNVVILNKDQVLLESIRLVNLSNLKK